MKIILIIIALIIIYILITYNLLVKKRIRVQQAKSGIDIYLKQRFDLIPNLVECVKGYCEYEKDTITQIAKLRTQYTQNKDLETGAELNKTINNLIAVAENYPELKANEQFTMLEKSLTKIESQLQASRRLYNGEVTALNISVDTFPSNLIAKIFHIKKEKLFELESSNEAKNININITDEENTNE